MSPKTINALMKHLRNQGVAVGGSLQKRQLRNIGYYHGYKGLRFAGSVSNMLPIDDFGQISSLYAMDMQIKTSFYPRIMMIETALKNYTLEAVLGYSKTEDFDEIYKACLTAYKDYSPGSSKYKKAWTQRIRLRQEVDALIFRNQESKPFFKHFRDRGRAIPIWAIFEAMTLGCFGSFYGCLSHRVKSEIVGDLGMPTACDSESLLLSIVFALKDLRNAIAHNAIVVDVRFKTGKVSSGVGRLLEGETGVSSVNFSDVTDYVVLVTYLLTLLGETRTERRKFVSEYEATLLRCKRDLPAAIYGKIIRTETFGKLDQLKKYVTKS